MIGTLLFNSWNTRTRGKLLVKSWQTFPTIYRVCTSKFESENLCTISNDEISMEL